VTFALLFRPSNDAAGKQFLSPEIVEDQVTVFAHRAYDLLHGLNSGAHDLTAPFVEKPAGPDSGVVFPELLKGFLKKVGPDGFEVVAQQIAKPETLFGFQILFAFEQEPARLLQNRRKAFTGQAAGLPSANFVQSLVHLRHDMEAVEDVKSVGALLADHFQIRLPYIGADEDDLGSDFVADHLEEALKGFDRSLFADPEQPDNAEVDLVDQRQIPVAFGVLISSTPMASIWPSTRCWSPKVTTCSTASKTFSHEVRNASAVSFHDRRPAQRARNNM
jgi:hypothetical protein